MNADKPLFTPGPLTTSQTVKEAMLRDLGSRDEEFVQTVATIRHALLANAGVSQQVGWEAVIMQGSGTFTIESALSSLIAPNQRLLIAINGAYGERMLNIARIHGIDVVAHRTPETQPLNPDALSDALDTHKPNWLALVHCETTTGILNPVEVIGHRTAKRNIRYLIDGMSAFGALPVHLDAFHADVYISSANKCIEGVPGFGFALCRRTLLAQTDTPPRTLSLDLIAQWKRLETDGQFRFTPPTHTLLAFAQALNELDAEGGPEARCARYRTNQQALVSGMEQLGFRTLLKPEYQSPIITTFYQPSERWFDFRAFTAHLHQKGFVIYPGKLSQAPCFRLGSIGQLRPEDIVGVLKAIEETLTIMRR